MEALAFEPVMKNIPRESFNYVPDPLPFEKEGTSNLTANYGDSSKSDLGGLDFDIKSRIAFLERIGIDTDIAFSTTTASSFDFKIEVIIDGKEVFTYSDYYEATANKDFSFNHTFDLNNPFPVNSDSYITTNFYILNKTPSATTHVYAVTKIKFLGFYQNF